MQSEVPPLGMIVVGVPLADQSPSQWWLHWQRWKMNTAFIPAVGTLVHDARNKIVREAMQIPDWKTLVMLDADVFPPPHRESNLDARVFIREYEADQCQVVAPLCYGRSIEHPSPVAGFFADEAHYRRLTGQEHDRMVALPGLHQVDVLGMGMVCIQRQVFEILEPPWFHHPVVDGQVLGEDHQFYRRLKAAGIPALLDTRWHVLHMGSIYYGQTTYQMWRDIGGD